MSAKAWMGLVGLLAVTLSACGGGHPAPEGTQAQQYDDAGFALPARYGLYVIDANGQLGRLDGEKSFQVETWGSRSSLDPDVQFIIFDRALSDRSIRLADAIKLRRVAHVRNDIGASGVATPLQKDLWVAPDFPEFAIALDFQPVYGSPEMVRVIPSQQLPPGLYSLQLRLGDTAVAGRFGVQWSKIRLEMSGR